MGLIAVCLLAVLLGFAAYVRLAPSEVARWHVDPSRYHAWDHAGGWGEVITRTDGAMLRVEGAAALLARLDALAMATPRTIRLAGSVEEGQITWVTRSGLWGFPDYTTAKLRADGLYIDTRLRFGLSDLGVNAKRLEAWRAQL